MNTGIVAFASVAKLTGAAPSQATVIHEPPAVMRNLEWRPRYFSGGVSSQTDPVDLMVFSFYDDQLFRVVVDYDRHRTSKPLPKTSRAAAVHYGAPDTPLAICGDTETSVTLLRVAYPMTYRLVVAFTRLEPQREVARQKKEADEGLAAQEEAKTKNKAVFRP